MRLSGALAFDQLVRLAVVEFVRAARSSGHLRVDVLGALGHGVLIRERGQRVATASPPTGRVLAFSARTLPNVLGGQPDLRRRF